MVVTSSTITTREPAGRFLRPSSHWPVPCPFGLLADDEGRHGLAFKLSGNAGGGGDRVGTESQPADSLNRPRKLLYFLPEGLADEQPAAGMQGGLLAIEIEVAFAPGSQRNLALLIGQLPDDAHQFVSFRLRHKIPPWV